MRPTIAGLALGGIVLAAMAQIHPLTSEELDCTYGGSACPPRLEIENPREKMALHDERAGRRGTLAPGARRAAVDRRAALNIAKSAVKGSGGVWQQYGRGPQIVSGLAQEQLDGGVPGGLPDTYLQTHSGRVDNFAYDPKNKRLFAAVGTGGIWMSEARNGDERTLGDLWVSVGDNLPTQVTSAVVYTGDTLIAATGDGVMSTGSYTGLGAYWSTDLGATWNHSNGIPDDLTVFNAAHDPGNPNIVYVATGKGLYRSDDAGRNFVNVNLPTGVDGECAGVLDIESPCHLANVVSDVVVRTPDIPVGLPDNNAGCPSTGCPVLAAVGWRAGQQFYGGTEVMQAPSNGIYKSATGQPGTFTRVSGAPAVAGLDGLTAPERIGRIEMGAATGPLQDHDYVYAMVQDSELLNTAPGASFDPPLDLLPDPPLATTMNGIFVSPDFGDSWIRMASSAEVASIPGPYVALIQPGAQGRYNQWIEVDPSPTRSVPPVPNAGIPTRLVFGLEEVFQSQSSLTNLPLNGILQQGPQDFANVGYYFSAAGELTPHPDQQGGIFIPITREGVRPEVDLGVCVFTGNDGGVFRQCTVPGQPLVQSGWGQAVNNGFYTLLPYGLGVAKDGTVWYGLQDNGSGHIEPDTRQSFANFGADGFYAEVDPDNSDIAYVEIQNGAFMRTNNRGATGTSIAPPYTRVNFANWFTMDPLDGKHMMTCANEVYETSDAPNVTSGSWDLVFQHSFVDEPDGELTVFTCTVADLHGPAMYTGACGDCGVTANDRPFRRELATNVGGDDAPEPGTDKGWHIAAAKGLPNRLITAIEIDPDDARTVYVGVGAYQSPYRGPNSFGEDSTGADVEAGNIFKSTDAGESFTDISGDLPKVPVDTIVARAGQLLIGTEAGPFISGDLDGGAWAPLGSGLPNVPITQFKLQPGNPNKLFASTFGRHVWTYEFPPDAQVQARDASRFGGALPGLLLAGLFLAAAGRRLRPDGIRNRFNSRKA